MSTIGMALLLCGVIAMSSEKSSDLQTPRAFGPMRNPSTELERALLPDDDLEPMPKPGPSDWLTAHPEPGQSFEQFVQSSPNRPDDKRNIIYLQPLGEFRQDAAPSLALLREYAAAYFQMEVRLLAKPDLEKQKITTRRNPTTHNRQFLTTDILATLKKQIPADAFCVLGITMDDLYPEPSWNFVFGQASFRERVGVYSFARYDPVFYGEPRGADYRKILLRRSGKVLAHETGHMFGLYHCTYYRCVFNGSNHLAESDARPMHACPVDLRKLQHSIGFNVTRRYATLYRFYRKVGFDDEAQWARHRLDWILGKDEAAKVIEAVDEGSGS